MIRIKIKKKSHDLIERSGRLNTLKWNSNLESPGWVYHGPYLSRFLPESTILQDSKSSCTSCPPTQISSTSQWVSIPWVFSQCHFISSVPTSLTKSNPVWTLSNKNPSSMVNHPPTSVQKSKSSSRSMDSLLVRV